MYPVICRIGPFEIYSFGVMVAAAALLCSFLMVREGKSFGIKAQEIYDLVFWAAVGGIIGARVFYIVLNFSFFLSSPAEIFMINHGGLAWQGGFVFGILAVVVFIRLKKRPLLVMADFIAPYLALAQAVGRIGCFLNGCCYGKEFVGGVYFPVHDAVLHPTQLYESALLLFLFFVLMRMRKRSLSAPGIIFISYVIFAPLFRFVVEFFRADHQPLFFGLSVFQYVCIVFFSAGIGMLIGRNWASRITEKEDRNRK